MVYKWKNSFHKASKNAEHFRMALSYTLENMKEFYNIGWYCRMVKRYQLKRSRKNLFNC
ncbi:hypothetical protein AXJ14_gp187 [Geobacillus virus E3]|uniref:hypothetical protein n=1 Tax=Geobacillus virus E3 TaxID=1572712 RepID=UPI000671B195|nr:hypothetical protein AXJ14_gp187 [Geobacillus virus E3]AJA41506.1 hypothetical protein E3_0187 [Geobacillus virus E3]